MRRDEAFTGLCSASTPQPLVFRFAGGTPGRFLRPEVPYSILGTATTFFLLRSGRIGAHRHVALCSSRFVGPSG